MVESVNYMTIFRTQLMFYLWGHLCRLLKIVLYFCSSVLFVVYSKRNQSLNKCIYIRYAHCGKCGWYYYFDAGARRFTFK